MQEFINNILKHSKANNACINLKEIEGTLVLEISDDRIGFNKNTITAKEGVGINQMDARIVMMQGKFTIVTSKSNRTVIKVLLPIQEKKRLTSFS
ncbi:sensor histidine kinase [Polaribacter filamentus]|uniref:sensor histidine kinase n=1 Tax=Polaribacter filamentus TaxID=53483 RepID=UPI00349EA4E6